MHERIIQAAIINHERTQVIVDGDGNLPQERFDASHGTAEGTLYEIGRRALANVSHVSVDYRHVVDGVQIYQTKPVPKSVEPSAPFRWGDCPNSVTLH